jgi:hypothetical protein
MLELGLRTNASIADLERLHAQQGKSNPYITVLIALLKLKLRHMVEHVRVGSNFIAWEPMVGPFPHRETPLAVELLPANDIRPALLMDNKGRVFERLAEHITPFISPDDISAAYAYPIRDVMEALDKLRLKIFAERDHIGQVDYPDHDLVFTLNQLLDR